jgi:hypothetical protein
MPLLSSPIPSPFLESRFVQREKGFGERLVDDLSDLTAKQTLGLPASVPLQLGAGALKGLSFGLADFTEDTGEALGEFALPETATSALDVAGEIGGSFVPFVGASAAASRIFKGLSAGAKLARGAFTFGAPELARQALTQEFDPTAAARSVATGAAFALPLPRLALAPAVAGTELLFGAEPAEAATAGLFAGIFGPMGAHDSLPRPSPTSPAAPSKALVRQGRQQLRTRPIPPQPLQLEGRLALTSSDDTLRRARVQVEDAKLLEGLPKETAAAGTRGLLGVPEPPKSQVQLLTAAADSAPPAAAPTLRRVAAEVEVLQSQSEPSLMATLNRALESGHESGEARIIRSALAQKRGGFVPAHAPVVSPLKPPVRGLDLIEPGPTNPFEVRSQFDDLLMEMRANGGAAGRTRATQLQQSVLETRQQVARARGRGEELSDDLTNAAIKRQERLLATDDVVFETEEEAFRTALTEMEHTIHPADVDAFTGNLAEWYEPVRARLVKAAESRKRVLADLENDASQGYRKMLSRQPKGFTELMTEASDAGLSVLPRERVTSRVLKSGRKPRTVIDSFTLKGYGGQDVKKFSSIEKGRDWLRQLEAGTVEPKNVHELRALGHGRGLVIDADGLGGLTVTNQLTGETVQGVQSMAEAVRIVRQAPNVASAAREIGPRVPGHPPLPGSGGLGGHATEQSPPFCPLSDDLE